MRKSISPSRTFPNLLFVGCLLVAAFGIYLRFQNIALDSFVFYDEGYYLNHSRNALEFIEQHSNLRSWSDIHQAVSIVGRYALATGKALWFFLSDLRVLWGGVQDWFYPRILSAFFGSLTMGMVFLFARRYYQSVWIGLLSVACLAVLPSHVFYSRLGLQEAASTFFFLAGLYCYLFPSKFGWRTFASAALMAAAFFTNYRLIILPGLMVVTEVVASLGDRRLPNVRKWFWHTLMFLVFVFGIGALDEGQNTRIIFAWMFHQANLAEGQFHWVNFLSYPYYLIRLENVVFGVAFWLGLSTVINREHWRYSLPFVVACAQMFLFSFAGEKGARYICVVLPLIVISVVYVFHDLWVNGKVRWQRCVVGFLLIVLAGGLSYKSWQVAHVRSDYKPAMNYILAHDPQMKILSTQPWVMNLFVKDAAQVREAPHSFEALVRLYSKGFKVLVIDPQAYISFTEDHHRFSPPLQNYLGFTVVALRPVKVFEHFHPTMLERFVFEHNEHLLRSVAFLREEKIKQGTLRIYDVGEIINAVGQRIKLSDQKEKNEG